MPNIFISYSRKDSQHALSLAERLRDEGMTVWIDQHGIGAAEQWATEIASSIRDCHSFVLLLSPASTSSENVLKELSLASEKSKRIVPVDINGQIELPVSFEYALAGIQRVTYGNFDAVLEAIRVGPKKVVVKDTRKSLMILPFEDLSPTHDNEWFADGLVSELIDTLSNIKTLRLIDRKTSFEYKSIRARTTEIASELGVRYFIDGNVRKFGEQVKISIQLLDIEEGEYLWTDSHKGEFKDIFDIQEEIAKKVVDGLKLKLSTDEERQLEERGTRSAEAFELYLKASESFDKGTKQGYIECCDLAEQAYRIDPGFVRAKAAHAHALLTLCEYSGQRETNELLQRKEDLLLQAKALIDHLLESFPDFLLAYYLLAMFHLASGNTKEAEEAAIGLVKKAPQHHYSHGTLAKFYMLTGQWEKAIVAFEHELTLNPDLYSHYWNLILCCDRANDQHHLDRWIPLALKRYEQRLQKNPNNDKLQVQYAILLRFAGEEERACELLRPFDHKPNVDSGFLFDIACFYARMSMPEKSVEYLTRAVDSGFHAIDAIMKDQDLASVRELPDFQRLVEHIESIKSSDVGQ